MAERRQNGRTTIREVAQEAGVSVSTVSLALANHPGVAETTKARVREIAERLNYRPSAMGRALQSSRTNAIGLIIPHSGEHVFSHLYFMEVMSGVSEVLNTANMTLVLSTSSSEVDEAEAYLKLQRSQQVDGVIIASAAIGDRNIESIQKSNFPFVFIGRYPQDPTMPAIGIDDFGGAKSAVEHIIEHGHHRIAHISGPLGHLSAIDRRDGYQAALLDAGIKPNPHYLFEGDFSEESGCTGMKALLMLESPPTALFAGNDETAIGAIQVLRQHGIEPGAGFPIVSFDDVVIARLTSPPLTTIYQPMRELGELAARNLLALLSGEKNSQPQIVLPTKLVVRHSCGCNEDARLVPKSIINGTEQIKE
jgi:LacI family transcriptional regulator, repressor for deo operon, udp, cdd, tsx, nupC, and nupG